MSERSELNLKTIEKLREFYNPSASDLIEINKHRFSNIQFSLMLALIALERNNCTDVIKQIYDVISDKNLEQCLKLQSSMSDEEKQYLNHETIQYSKSDVTND